MTTKQRDRINWLAAIESFGVLAWVLIFAGCVIGAIVEAAQ